MTVEGTKKVNEARNKYINLFSELIHGMFPNMAMLDILNRISQIMLLIPVLEVIFNTLRFLKTILESHRTRRCNHGIDDFIQHSRNARNSFI